MAWTSKFKTLGTGLLATRSKWIRWPKRQPAAREVAGDGTRELPQARVPLWSYTTDRKQIFSGPNSTPSLTGKGVLELWKNESQHLAESESEIATKSSTVFSTRELPQARVPLWSYTTDRKQILSGPYSTPSLTGKGVLELWENESQHLAEGEPEIATESSTVFRMCKLVLVLGGVAGIYFIVRWHRNRKRSAAVQSNIAFQQAIVQGVMGAVVEGVKDPVVQAAKQAIEQGFRDVQNLHVQAIITAVAEAFQNAHAQALEDVPPVPAQNLTTKNVIKAFLAAGNGQEIDLEAFLNCMGLGHYLPILQRESVLKVEDLSRSSEEQLAGCGILQDQIVKLKKGAFYLLDLHNPSFTLR